MADTKHPPLPQARRKHREHRGSAQKAQREHREKSFEISNLRSGIFQI
jgi:hypothetical protein